MMVYVPYHSGSVPDTLNLAEERLPRRTSPAARALTLGPTFKVFFNTSLYRPAHLVTIRNAVDGWNRDIFGTYRNGAWMFEFETGRFGGGLDMKFVLDRAIWMAGQNLILPNTQDHHFNEANVIFHGAASRYRHGYDNLRNEETSLQQDSIRSNTSAGALYDVIVIGSGIGGGILADALSHLRANTLVL